MHFSQNIESKKELSRVIKGARGIERALACTLGCGKGQKSAISVTNPTTLTCFTSFHPTQKVLKIGAFIQELKRQMCIKRAGWRCAKQPVCNQVRIRRLTSGWWNRAVMFCEGLEAAHLVWRNAPDTSAATGRKALWPQPSWLTAASTGISLKKSKQKCFYAFNNVQKQLWQREFSNLS